MSTEEKITDSTETVKPTKPKHRFKLDKKHIQGFISGILVTAIAFAGLYYGTEGRFFKGTMYASWIKVTDTTFEDEVIKSYLPVVVLFYGSDAQSQSQCQMIKNYASTIRSDISFAFADVRKAPVASAQYFVVDVPTYVLFKNGEMVSKKVTYMSPKEMGDWILRYY